MNTVIFNTENAVIKFTKKEVKENLICKQSEYAPDEVNQLLKLISTDSGKIILSSVSHHYFGYVALDLINAGIGSLPQGYCNSRRA